MSKRFIYIFTLAILAAALCEVTSQQEDESREKTKQKKQQLDSYRSHKEDNFPLKTRHQNENPGGIFGPKKMKFQNQKEISTGSRQNMDKPVRSPVQLELYSKKNKGKKTQSKVIKKQNVDPNGRHHLRQLNKGSSFGPFDGIINVICNLLQLAGLKDFPFLKVLCIGNTSLTTTSVINTKTSTVTSPGATSTGITSDRATPSSSKSATVDSSSLITSSITPAPVTVPSTISTTTSFQTTTPSGTYFNHKDGDEFILTCSSNTIVIQAAFYGSQTCVQQDVTALLNNMTKNMQTFTINPSAPIFLSSCQTESTLYGWYTCNTTPPPYAAVGAAYNSTFSIRCPVSGQLILLQSLNYITPAMDCNVYKDQAHTSEFFVSNICKLHSSCSFSVTNKNVVFFPITVCTPNPYMYLKAEYQCS